MRHAGFGHPTPNDHYHHDDNFWIGEALTSDHQGSGDVALRGRPSGRFSRDLAEAERHIDRILKGELEKLPTQRQNSPRIVAWIPEQPPKMPSVISGLCEPQQKDRGE
jgi:hypothetical protein